MRSSMYSLVCVYSYTVMRMLKASTPREIRDLVILAMGSQIRRIDASTYRVRSQSGNGWRLVQKSRSRRVTRTRRSVFCHMYWNSADLQKIDDKSSSSSNMSTYFSVVLSAIYDNGLFREKHSHPPYYYL